MGGKLFFLVALELPSTGCLGFGACARKHPNVSLWLL
jgi:hypothetical protein